MTATPLGHPAADATAVEQAVVGPIGPCGARRIGGTPCPRPPMPGKRRCRQHGGAPGIGAPKGSQNALKDGAFTRAALAERKAINDFIRACLQTMREIEGR